MNRMLGRGSLRAIGALALVAAASFSTESIADPTRTNSERFKLWNECRPVKVNVGISRLKDAKRIIGAKEIFETVRNKVMAARLYSRDSHESILVQVYVRDAAFAVQYKFLKKVLDQESLETGYAVTWDNLHTSKHDGTPAFVLAVLPLLTDDFLEEYRRANLSACSR